MCACTWACVCVSAAIVWYNFNMIISLSVQFDFDFAKWHFVFFCFINFIYSLEGITKRSIYLIVKPIGSSSEQNIKTITKIKEKCVNTKLSFWAAVALANLHWPYNLFKEFSSKNMIQQSKTATGNKSKWTDSNACWKFWIQLER